MKFQQNRKLFDVFDLYKSFVFPLWIKHSSRKSLTNFHGPVIYTSKMNSSIAGVGKWRSTRHEIFFRHAVKYLCVCIYLKTLDSIQILFWNPIWKPPHMIPSKLFIYWFIRCNSTVICELTAVKTNAFNLTLSFFDLFF